MYGGRRTRPKPADPFAIDLGQRARRRRRKTKPLDWRDHPPPLS
jgi:hypothetical protein